MIKCRCEDCKVNFYRTKEYLAQDRTDALYRWTTKKCDACKERRINLAFKRLPAILKTLAE